MGTALGQTLIVMPAYNESQSVGAWSARRVPPSPASPCWWLTTDPRTAPATPRGAAGALVATLPFNLGVGGAMRVGFRYAAQHGFARWSRSTPMASTIPATVGALLARLDDHDIVIGARFAGEGAYVMRGPRRWASKVLAWTHQPHRACAS